MPRFFGVLMLVVAAACTRERWDCEACLGAEPGTCASSASYGRPTEEAARCDAAEGVCAELDQASFDRICKDKISVRTGCAPALYEPMRLTCSAKSELSLPGGGVR